MRWAAKRDEAEPEIKEYLESMGYLVFLLSAAGWPDMVVVRPDGTIRFLEVKSSFRGKLTKAQQSMMDRGLPFEIVWDKYTALHAVRS